MMSQTIKGIESLTGSVEKRGAVRRPKRRDRV